MQKAVKPRSVIDNETLQCGCKSFMIIPFECIKGAFLSSLAIFSIGAIDIPIIHFDDLFK